MMKRIFAFLLILVLAVSSAGCAENKGPGGSTDSNTSNTNTSTDTNTETPDPAQPVSADTMPVLGRDGSVLGEIGSRAVCTAVDGGIFYSISDLREYQTVADTEYRFFSMESGQDIPLGTLENQGYEGTFLRTEYGGKIYTLAVQGDPVSNPQVPLILLAADPVSGTMKKHTVSENGFPYASMAVSGGKLLIMSHEMSEPACDRIYEFDPASEALREVLTFSRDTDSLRGICAAADGFCLLRLKISGSGENEMFLDRYDGNYGRVSEESVNEVLIRAISEIPVCLSREDALNELGMNVSRFAVRDGRYLIYENFGFSRLIVDLESGETVLARDDTYAVSGGSGAPYVYRMDFDPDDVEEPDITGIVDGRTEQLSFAPVDSHRLIRSVSHSAGGTWLIQTSDVYSMLNSTFALCLWTE